MLNILQIEDRLKDMSQDAVMEALNNPNPVIPPFMALAELNRRKRMNDDLAMRQAQNQQTVKDQVVAGAGMPMEMASDMATAMAPKSDIAGNTGLEAMMQSNTLPSEYNDDIAMMDTEFEDEPMEMSGGGLIPRPTGTEVGFPINTQVAVPKKTGMLSRLMNIPKFVPKAPTPLGLGVTGLMTAAPFLLNYFMGDDEEDKDETDYTDMRKYDDLDDGDEDDAPVKQPPPDPTYEPSYIPQIMQQLQEDREALKSGKDQDMGLALMTAGLKIADRGQLSEGVAGVEQLAQANQAYRENLRNLSSLGVQAGVAGDTIAQKAMQAQMSYDKAIELAKIMGGGDVIKGIDTLGDQIQVYNEMIASGFDLDGVTPLAPERVNNLKNTLKRLQNIQQMLVGKLEGQLGGDVIASP